MATTLGPVEPRLDRLPDLGLPWCGGIDRGGNGREVGVVGLGQQREKAGLAVFELRVELRLRCPGPPHHVGHHRAAIAHLGDGFRHCVEKAASIDARNTSVRPRACALVHCVQPRVPSARSMVGPAARTVVGRARGTRLAV